METETVPTIEAVPAAVNETAVAPNKIVDLSPIERALMERHGVVNTLLNEEIKRLGDHIQVITEDQAQAEIEMQRKKRAFDSDLQAARKKFQDTQMRAVQARQSFDAVKGQALQTAGVDEKDHPKYIVEVGPNFSVLRLFLEEPVPPKES
jgi:predicted DNA-binding protein (UPF0251 family)